MATNIRERLQQDVTGARQLLKTSKRHWTTGRALRKEFIAAQQSGRKIVLDDFGPDTPDPEPGQPAADFNPKPGKARKAHFMKLDEYPSTNYAFEVQRPPVSGNVINGLG